jgi:gliding motility-associated-like protein
MKRNILFFIGLFLCASLQAQYEVRGGTGIPLKAETRSGTDIYLLNGLSGAQISFTSENPGTHQWFKYTDNGANATPVESVQEGNTSTITNIEDGCGYFVGSPETLYYYVWIIDYSRYKPKFFGLEVSEDEFRCELLRLITDVEAEPIYYNLPSGAQYALQRTYKLTYNTMEWQDDTHSFVPKIETLELKGLISEILLDEPPLANTVFTLTGDAFAEHFGISETLVSAEYAAVAVEAHATYYTDKEHADNELHDTGDNLGGSAPIEYTFTAYANEPIAAFYLWKVLKTEENGTTNTIVRYTDKILRYNFEALGNYVVQLEVMDSRSACIDTSQVFRVTIGETFIKIPNVFSPGSSIGTNDELKVSFRSITVFKASIYNRWGNLLYQWTDPTRGWDGRVNGRFVPTGAYYIIVEYTDSEGKKHSQSRDVNILRAKN